METALRLFEKIINKQIEIVGREKAIEQAIESGMEISDSGRIIRLSDDVEVVLLRLIKNFTAGGNMVALTQCMPLIEELLKIYKIDINTCRT